MPKPPAPLTVFRLVQDTALSTSILAARLIAQLTWTVALARLLGPDGYGLLAGISAFGLMLGTLTGLGFGVLLLQGCAQEPSRFSALWKQATVIACISGLTLLLMFAWGGPLLLGASGSWALFLGVGVAELICFPMIGIASQAFQAHGRIGWGSSLLLLPTVGNIIALLAFLASSESRTALSYIPYHAAGAVGAAGIACALVHHGLRPAPIRFRVSWGDIAAGAEISLIRLADAAQATLDKVMTLKIGGSHAAGIYTSGYRLASLATTPLVALTMTTLPHLFRSGGHPGQPDPALIRNLLISTIAYGALASVIILTASPLIPFILGSDFQSAVSIARWLSIFPLIHGLYILGANVLLTHQRGKWRLIAQCISIFAMITTATVFIPHFGALGAVAAVLITQTLSALIVWLLVAQVMRAVRR